MGGGPRRELRALETAAGALAEQDARAADARLAALQAADRGAARTASSAIPFLDPFDLRYRNRVRVPLPTSKAVMFCLMDVSGSMDEARKDLAKRFFILLYLFLTRHYEQTEVVFIRHHTQAAEVDEDEFFHATESGGTVVSSALTLMHEIIRARYRGSEWNIYGAQASDGDNWQQDSSKCRELLDEQAAAAVPLFRLRAGRRGETRTCGRNTRGGGRQPALRDAEDRHAAEIFPVFRDLFKKR